MPKYAAAKEQLKAMEREELRALDEALYHFHVDWQAVNADFHYVKRLFDHFANIKQIMDEVRENSVDIYDPTGRDAGHSLVHIRDSLQKMNEEILECRTKLNSIGEKGYDPMVLVQKALDHVSDEHARMTKLFQDLKN